ncbi:uncharacterized protein [Amphiura filiformis]|uniref:uncharacterized protein n=1 Tax=Amphiura filiformis TaxID=82378 RepID=UPI003B211A78
MAASYITSAEEELSCPLCVELFVDANTPKQLDCPHVYCQKCLIKMVKGGLCVISCPECRAVTRVPPKTPVSEGGVAALRTSIRLRNLAENHLKHTEQHRVGDASSKETVQTICYVPTCPVHDDEKLHFYCITCKVLVCQACGFLDHDKSTHEIKGVKTIYAEKLQHMKNRMKTANDEAKKNEHSVQKIQQLQKQVAESTAGTEQEIDQAVAKMIENGKALKMQLSELSQKHLLEYQKQKEELDRENQDFRKVIAEAGRVMESATPYEYVTKHDQLEETFDQIQLVGKRKKEVDHVTQAATSYKFISEQVGGLGKLVPVRKMNRTQAIRQGAKHIGGGNGKLPVCQEDRVHIYHKQATDEYHHELDLNVKDACDVAVTGNGMYMVATPTSVEVFGARGQHERTFYETKGRDGVRCRANQRANQGRKTVTDIVIDKVSSIAVLSDGRVIVGNEDTKTLAELMHDGTKQKTIELGFVPFSLTAMKGSQVALCGEMYKVCVLDVDSGREVLSVDIPLVRCVCYDKMSDCLMIGSEMVRNGKIQQYCVSPWKLITTVDTGSDIPVAMTFADTNDLAVGFKIKKSVSAVDYIKIYKCRENAILITGEANKATESN